jgi:hypothetical protein
MADHSTTQCWLFPDLLNKALLVRFDEEMSSSDGARCCSRPPTSGWE